MELAGEYSLLEQTTAKWKKHYDAISKTEEWEAPLCAGDVTVARAISSIMQHKGSLAAMRMFFIENSA